MKYLLFLFAIPLFAQTNAQIAFVATSPSGVACNSRASLRLYVPSGVLFSCQSGHYAAFSTSSATGTVTSLTASSPLVATPSPIIATGTYSCPTCTITVFSGTLTLNTTLIASAACSTAQTVTATGTATTDTIIATFNADVTGITGYVPLTTGMLTIIVYPTVNTINAKVCNNTSASITPSAVTLNVRVAR